MKTFIALIAILLMCGVAYAEMQTIIVNGKATTCITNGNITQCF